ncbi:pyridoxal phosphate-dependent decarboxylase family protein [Halodesulfovibrio aestuarii]|uniref:Aspartate aminotransferase family protein n=1 Tax=Halodesulfovibrio aestuarii TaxID=126333 RepID=A0ABV4JZQ7_9BACT
MASAESVISELAEYFEGLPLWGHELVQANVIPPATIPSIMGYLYSTLFNPNLIWDEYSYRVSEAEVELCAICAQLIGYDPKKSTGITTWGGTGTNFYGIRLGIEKALPEAFAQGVRQEVKLFCSSASHYSKLNALGWMGVGTNNLVNIPTDEDNSIRIDLLENKLRQTLDVGERIACILPTLGTTDSFGLDHLERIYHLREKLVREYDLKYVPHIHADAVIGWAWAVFNDYDFSENPMNFPRRTLRSLRDVWIIIQNLHLADSIGIDFHKTGYAPYLSSLFMVKNKDDFKLIARTPDAMPYLFQFGNYRPGIYTMESSRGSGAALSALANLKFFGKQGYRALLGYIVTIAESLRLRLEQSPYGVVVNDYNHGPVTLFRVYPDTSIMPNGRPAKLETVEGTEEDAIQRVTPTQLWYNESHSKDYAEMLVRHNAFNRRVFDIMHNTMANGGCLALSLTENYRYSVGGTPILALKSFVMTPFVSEDAMTQLMHCLEKARKQAMAELSSISS